MKAVTGWIIALAGIAGGALVLFPTGVAAQSGPLGVAPALGATVGSTGIGAELSARFGPRFGARLGAAWIPWELEIEEEDVRGEASPPSPIVRLTADYFPWGGTFHLSAGVAHFSGGASGSAFPQGNVEIGGTEYTAEEVGEFRGRMWGRETAPYFGLGWQSSGGRIQPYLELGAALTGAPKVTIEVLGPAGQDPSLLADLEEEIREIEDDASAFKAYPVLVFGLRMRLGG